MIDGEKKLNIVCYILFWFLTFLAEQVCEGRKILFLINAFLLLPLLVEAFMEFQNVQCFPDAEYPLP